MKEPKAHDFEKMYDNLGIDLNKLGCVMLDVEPPKSRWDSWGNLDTYVSTNPDHKWINGWVLDKHAHITLLYGLLKPAKEYKKEVEEVLKGWELKKAEIEDIGFFDSPYSDEPYWCIIAHIKVTPELLEGHQRLEFLPHINTNVGYKPHMTIVYIKKDRGIKYRDMLIDIFKESFIGKDMKVFPKINFGGNK